MSINGANPMQEAAELLNGEAGGRILSDAERAEKRRLLEAHKRAYVGVRKNALKSERVKTGKDLPEKKNASLCSRCRPCLLRAGRKCDFFIERQCLATKAERWYGLTAGTGDFRIRSQKRNGGF